MVDWIGFEGIQPFAIVLWIEQGVARSKTFCYCNEELQQTLKRFWDEKKAQPALTLDIIFPKKEVHLC